MGLTETHCSCISWVGAGTSRVGGTLATFCQVTLCPCTIYIVIPGWTTSSSKGSISRSFNCSWVSQLTAHNYSIKKVPVVITHSAPMAKQKDLNTTFQQSISSHQSYRAFCSCVVWCYIYGNKETCTWWLFILTVNDPRCHSNAYLCRLVLGLVRRG